MSESQERPVKPYNPGHDAARLVKLAESGELRSQGAWISWAGRIKRLPYKLQLWVWKRLKNVMSTDSLRYLKDYCKGSGGSDDNR